MLHKYLVNFLTSHTFVTRDYFWSTQKVLCTENKTFPAFRSWIFVDHRSDGVSIWGPEVFSEIQPSLFRTSTEHFWILEPIISASASFEQCYALGNRV